MRTLFTKRFLSMFLLGKTSAKSNTGRKAFSLLQFCFVVILSAHSVILSAQVTAGFFPDSTKIQIGDYLGVKFSVKHAEGVLVQFPVFKDSLGDLEIVSLQKIDTSKVGNESLLTQRITVSAYDSGLYSILPYKVYFSQNGLLDSVYTEVQFVEVSTLPVDTSKPIKPIKAPLDVNLKLVDYLPFIIGGIIFVILVLLAWWLYRRFKKKEVQKPLKERPKEPAHIWAMKELQKLEQEKIWQKEDVKVYYTRLTDILRMYLEYRYDVLAMESTTDEIREMISRDDVPIDVQQKLIEILKLADLVKFAKMTPLPDEHHRNLIYSREFVKATTPQAESVSLNQKNVSND